MHTPYDFSNHVDISRNVESFKHPTFYIDDNGECMLNPFKIKTRPNFNLIEVIDKNVKIENAMMILHITNLQLVKSISETTHIVKCDGIYHKDGIVQKCLTDMLLPKEIGVEDTGEFDDFGMLED